MDGILEEGVSDNHGICLGVDRPAALHYGGRMSLPNGSPYHQTIRMTDPRYYPSVLVCKFGRTQNLLGAMSEDFRNTACIDELHAVPEVLT